MKGLGILWLTALGVFASGGELEGDVWYDADGKVAYVEGPAAEPLPEPFVPAWERRRAKAGAAEPRFVRGVSHRGYRQRAGYRWGGWYGYPGWSVCRPAVRVPFHPWQPRAVPRGGGVRIILR